MRAARCSGGGGGRDGLEEAGGEGAEEDEELGHRFIYRWCKRTFREWSAMLEARDASEARTAAGKNAMKTMKQCKDYIRPLYRMCQSRTLSPQIRAALVRIIRHCQAGEFVRAHDQYIQLAIGNAAWPIGVTMVGIHARSGREKIESAKVAHVMNDEEQRKYLTSIKRLMSFVQSTSTANPSKKMG